jgi:tRNA(Leu) C34 or U34 (ribose-2'-O)-methylase TrmL
MSFGVILHEPEQPGNTGAIGRTCICAGASLHLIQPLGFLTDEKSVRRAGLDYWPRLGVREYENMDDFLRQHPGARIWYLTTKAKHTIDEGEYKVVSYTVREGDTLWSIANRNAHKGDKTEDYIAHITAMNEGLKMWTGEVIEILK